MGTLAAIWAAMTSGVGRVASAVAGVLVLLGGAYLHGRRTATDTVRLRAAEQEQEARRRADAAAADAERDGAAERLRSGRF